MEPLAGPLNEIGTKTGQPLTKEELLNRLRKGQGQAKALREWADAHPFPFDQPELIDKWYEDQEALRQKVLGVRATVYTCLTCHDRGLLITGEGQAIDCPVCGNKKREDTLKKYAGHPMRRWKDTFETFDLEKAPRMTDAIKAAFEFCQRTSPPWLVLAGGVGCGKTHVCYAIANQMAKEGVTCRYWTVPELLDAMRSTYNDQPSAENTTPRLTIDEMTYDPQVLILDDLGAQKGSDWVTEKLIEIIDRRYREGKGLVVTTNEPFTRLDDRLKSRFQDKEMCRVVVCDSPDFRPKLAAKKLMKEERRPRRRNRDE